MRNIRVLSVSILLMILLPMLPAQDSSQPASLGDVARQQRSKKKVKAAESAAKVVTNEDLPERPPDEVASHTEDPAESTDPASPSLPSARANGKSAQQWKAQILTQKRIVSAQQANVDRFRASIHFVDAGRYWNGAQYNEQQRRRQIQLEQMEKQLEQQKKRLSDMQDAARCAGFGNSVSDPNE